MKNLMLARYHPFVRDFLLERPLFVFDYDGTLAPIIDQPDRVKMRSRTAVLLRRLAQRYPTAIVSGRSRDDVRARTRDLGIEWWVGNHGGDWGVGDRREAGWSRRVGQWKRVLADEFPEAEGFEIEDKRYSLSIHYRSAKKPRAALAQILRTADQLEGCRIVGGKYVVNLVPVNAPDKGSALIALMKKTRTHSAIFIGDDVTDEDAFRVARHNSKVIGVRVGLSQNSNATFGIPTQQSLDALLAKLLELS